MTKKQSLATALQTFDRPPNIRSPSKLCHDSF